MIERLTHCQLCDSTNFVGLGVGASDDAYRSDLGITGDLGWCLCTECCYVFQNPRASRETQESYYTKSSYRKATPEPIPQGYIDFAPYQLLRFEAWLLANNISVRNFTRKTCLDYGCGIGGALDFLTRQDNLAYGVELDQHLTDYGNKHYGVQIVPRLENLPQSTSFDFIFSHNAIEHVYDPNEFFAFANKRLTPDGQLMIVLPAWRYSNTEETLGEFNSSHNTMWDHISLSGFLNKYGFYMTSYLYQNPVPDGGGDWEICALAVRSPKQNIFTWSIEEVLRELQVNIADRIRDRQLHASTPSDRIAVRLGAA